MKTPGIITRGKDNGEGMVIHYQTARGTDIYGMALPNIYAHADWDLGPTWCYLIAGRKTTLIDSGRVGNFDVFTSLLESTGKKLTDIDRIVISHSHEDHDGNVAEILSAAKAELLAHKIYQSMISYHPDVDEGAPHPEFPGSCRLCRMPESFYSRNCLPYHKARSSLKVDFAIEDGHKLPDADLSFLYTPGHSPDSLCVILEDEVIFSGDTLLPDITSHPSLTDAFIINRRILPEEFQHGNRVYGLMSFIESLNRIANLSSQPLEATFPAHRLFYNGRFNLLDSRQRAKEIIEFHIRRCQDILKIVDSKPTKIKDIVVRYFPPSRLAGMGKSLAENEVRAHLEIMRDCGDVRWQRNNEDIIERTGTSDSLARLSSYS